MSAEIVNLRQFRKERARADREAKAADNRVRHGLTRAEREAAERQRSASERHIEAHRLDPKDDGAA